MNGLRMYILSEGRDALADKTVFYSRRGNGPFYRWDYQDKVENWHVARIITGDFDPHSLSAAPWKVVPASLQTRLSQHYSE